MREATSLVGQRANPHPQGDPKYVTEVIEQTDDGEVFVRYVDGGGLGWWITEAAWRDWYAIAPAHKAVSP